MEAGLRGRRYAHGGRAQGEEVCTWGQGEEVCTWGQGSGGGGMHMRAGLRGRRYAHEGRAQREEVCTWGRGRRYAHGGRAQGEEVCTWGQGSGGGGMHMKAGGGGMEGRRRQQFDRQTHWWCLWIIHWAHLQMDFQGDASNQLIVLNYWYKRGIGELRRTAVLTYCWLFEVVQHSLLKNKPSSVS